MMKITPRSLHTNAGIHMKHNKLKKLKILKKTSDKTLKEENDRDLQERLTVSSKKLPTEENVESFSDGSTEIINSKNEIKKNQIDKRKQENSEWKTLKKIDCQRLETVMEEGQLSNEEARTTENSETESDSDFSELAIDSAESGKSKAGAYGTVAISEQPELWKNEEESDDLKREAATERGDGADKCDAEEVPETIALDARDGVIGKRNGMMEILPIFSNDRFACSRDAISVEEYEELEPLEKRASSTGDGNKKEIPQDRVMESAGGVTKDSVERKMRYKMLTDRTLIQKTSSQFINSLLVLSPFATEREDVFRESKRSHVQSVDIPSFCSGFHRVGRIRGGDYMVDLRPVPLLICTTIGLFSVVVALAWKSYRPPCMMDYILELLPFARRRRTYAQLLIDELLKILYSIIGAL